MPRLSWFALVMLASCRGPESRDDAGFFDSGLGEQGPTLDAGKADSGSRDSGLPNPDGGPKADAGTDAGAPDAGQRCDLAPLLGTSVINIDLRTALFSATLTMDGLQPPDGFNGSTRGWVHLNRRDPGGGSVDLQLPSMGVSSLAVPVAVGTYDVSFKSNEGSGGLPGEQWVLLEKNLVLNGPVMRSWDLKTAVLTSTVTVNGAQMPDAPQAPVGRGWFWLRSPAGSSVTMNIEKTGPASFQARLLKGSWDIFFVSGPSQAVLPGGIATVARGLSIQGPLTRPDDLCTTSVSGTVTLNGQVLADNGVPGYSRGQVVLAGENGAVPVPLTATGPGSFSQSVFCGRYDVRVETPITQTVLPPGGAVTFQQSTLVTAPANWNLDLHTATLSGVLTLNGATMPDNQRSTRSRAALVVSSRAGGLPIRLELAATGAAAWSTPVFLGAHDLRFEPETEQYQDVTPPASTVVATGIAVTANEIGRAHV